MTLQGWLLTTIILGLAIAIMVVSKAVLTPFVVGLILAYILSPAVEVTARRGLPRSLASALPVALAIIILGLIMALALPLLVEQLSNFVQKLPGYINQLQKTVLPPKVARFLHLKTLNNDALLALFGNFSTDSASMLAANLTRLYTGAVAVFNMTMLVIMTPLVAFYLMHDWPQLETRILRALPRKWRATVVEMITHIDQRLSSYLRGQLFACLLLGLYYAVALELAGLELGWVLGMMAGLLAFIPVVGAMIAVTSMLAMALVQYQMTAWEPYAIIAGIYMLGQMLESSILVPMLVGNKVGLHPVWVIFALLAGGEMAGIVGMILAIPVAVIISVVLPYLMKAWHNAVS